MSNTKTTAIEPSEKTTRKPRVSLQDILKGAPKFEGMGETDYVRADQVAPEPPVFKANELLREPLLLASWRICSSVEWGDFAAMTLTRQSGEVCLVTCGGVAVMRKLADLANNLKIHQDHDGLFCPEKPILTGFDAVGGGRGKQPCIIML